MPNELLDEHAFQSVEPTPPKRSPKEKALLWLNIYFLSFVLIICLSFVYIRACCTVWMFGMEIVPGKERPTFDDVILIEILYLYLWVFIMIIFSCLIIRHEILAIYIQGYKNFKKGHDKNTNVLFFFTNLALVITVLATLPLGWALLGYITLAIAFILKLFWWGMQYLTGLELELPIYYTDFMFFIMTIIVFGLLYLLFRKQVNGYFTN